MNRENVEFAISVMEGVKSLNMLCDEAGDPTSFICHLAATKQYGAFAEAEHGKGEMEPDGHFTPFDSDGDSVLPDSLLAEFLGVYQDTGYKFVYEYTPTQFFSVPFQDVEPRHVIERLGQVLRGELK